MKYKLLLMFFLIVGLFPMVWSADLSYGVENIDSLRSQRVAEQQQLYQARHVLENVRVRYAMLMRSPAKSVTSEEWEEAIMAREDAEAHLASLTIAVNNVSSFIQLVNAKINSLKNEQKNEVIQNNHSETVFLETAIGGYQNLLALERARLVTLKKWVAVQKIIVALNKRLCERLFELREEQRHHVRVNAMLAAMYRLQVEQSRLLTHISEPKKYGNNENESVKESKIKNDLLALQENYNKYVQKRGAFQAQLEQRQIQTRKQYRYNLYQRESLCDLTWFGWSGLVQNVVDVPRFMKSYVCIACHHLAAIFQGLSVWWFVMLLSVSFGLVIAYFYLYRHLTRVIRYFSLISRRFSQDFLYFFFILLKDNIFIFPFLLFFIAAEFFIDFDFRLVINSLLLIIGTRMAIRVTRMFLLGDISSVVKISPLAYVRLRSFFLVAAAVSFCVFMTHYLPVDAVIRELFNRIFMLVLLVLSILLFRAWFSFPILLQHIFVVRRSYIMNATRFFCRILPVTLFSNAIIGLVGYVELAWFMGRLQVIALIVIFCYLVARGLIFDLIELCYEVTIRHVKNGWLWTQVALKPLDKILRLTLVGGAVWMLIVAYGLNHNQKFLLFLRKILTTPLLDLGGNLISLMFFMKTILFISVLYWVGKWSREYAFRSLYVSARDIGLRNSLAVFTQYAVVALGITIALKVLGLDFTGLAVVAAAFAAGIGFGLRDLANNFFSGILLLVERPLRAGDRVTIGPYEGEIISTGMRSMKVRTSDHVEVIVPNSDMFTKPFVNWTLQDSIVRSVIIIRLDRIDDPHTVQNLIYGVLKNCRALVDDPAPEVFMTELSDSLIQMEVRYCINLQVDPSRSRVRSEVLFAIWDCFQQHGIHPPYPHIDMVTDSVSMPKHGVP